MNEKEFENFKDKFSFFQNKIENNEYFSWLSYGDGELFFMFNRRAFADRERYYPGYGDKLIETVYKCKSPNLYLSVLRTGCRYRKLINQFEELTKKANIEKIYDARLFHDLLKYNALGDKRFPPLVKKFLEILRGKKLVLVGGKYLEVLKENGLLKDFKLIETSTVGTYLENERIEKEILSYGKPAVYCFSVGITSNILIGDLHGKLQNSFLLDFGTFWDFLLGIGPRKLPEWGRLKFKNIKELTFDIE